MLTAANTRCLFGRAQQTDKCPKYHKYHKYMGYSFFWAIFINMRFLIIS